MKVICSIAHDGFACALLDWPHYTDVGKVSGREFGFEHTFSAFGVDPLKFAETVLTFYPWDTEQREVVLEGKFNSQRVRISYYGANNISITQGNSIVIYTGDVNIIRGVAEEIAKEVKRYESYLQRKV